MGKTVGGGVRRKIGVVAISPAFLRLHSLI